MSNLSDKQKHQLHFLDDIYEISCMCSTKTYIWGGLVMDILECRFLREHKDIDCFTLNLLDFKGDMAAIFKERGYATELSTDIDMFQINKDGYEAAFNRLELNDETAMWRHIGNEGTLYFPRIWLADTPRDFYNTHVYISGIEFEYCIKARVELLSPIWQLREKDIEALEYFTRLLIEKKVNLESVLRTVRSDNPYWRKRGHNSKPLLTDKI
jgi:hypothetical protein